MLLFAILRCEDLSGNSGLLFSGNGALLFSGDNVQTPRMYRRVQKAHEHEAPQHDASRCGGRRAPPRF